MKRIVTPRFAVPLLALAALGQLGARLDAAENATAPSPELAPPAAPVAADPKVERGAYLVTVGGCNDCHTPWKLGPNGPELDMDRMLSGHPSSLPMPPAPELPAGPWNTSVGATFTAWSGPWGVSFTANLTPDPETGTGKWSEQEFFDTIRSGRHLGRGRQLLPPMPWFNYAKMTDEDLSAVYAYLRTIPPIVNKVPDPLPPAAAH
jgi:mono/diheme cytochrome c family protein